ncbi:hypothetical protein Hanom_Chr12g01120481 [Helianthus anomalus]
MIPPRGPVVFLMWLSWVGSSLEVTGSTPTCGIRGDVPMMARFLPRHGSGWRANRFYLVVIPASLSCRGSMVSGRRSACAGAGARSNIASSRAGLTGDCL